MENVETTTTTTYDLSVTVPFPSKREAEVAYDVLRVDPEPPQSLVQKTIKLDGNKLLVTFSSGQAKKARVALTSFFDNVILCAETLDQFGPPAAKYNHY